VTALVRLYPRRWRDRYETEFLGLLEARPPSGRDRVDIVLGAIDARLHGEIPDQATGPAIGRRPVRALAVVAAVAGAAWFAWMAVLLLLFKGWGSGQPQDLGVLAATPVVAGLAMAVVHAALAMIAGGTMRPDAVLVASLTAVVFGLATFVGGPLLLAALIGSAVVATDGIGGGLPGWLRLAWIASVVAVIAAILAFIGGGGLDVRLLVGGIPYGVVWLLIAVTLALRGIPADATEATSGATRGTVVEP
jgi:hypothetical protein